jgi:predicted Fe-Mo cluster-binding NifX family protein
LHYAIVNLRDKPGYFFNHLILIDFISKLSFGIFLEFFEFKEIGLIKGGRIMKLAVSAKGQTLDSELDPRFGRAKYFLLVDPEGDSLEVVENKQNLERAQGAGIQAAQNVVESGAQAVLTGNCGPKAFKVLEAAKIQVAVGLSGTVREALRHYKENKVSYAQGPNVEGHW